MIYHHKSPEVQGYLSTGKHAPTTEEVIDALQDLMNKLPGLGAVDLVIALRAKHQQWVLDNSNWVELQEKLDM